MMQNRFPDSYPTCDNDCAWCGYTLELIGYPDPSSDGIDIHISVKPDCDLDSSFMAFDHGEQEMIRLNGWHFTFEEVAE